MNETVYKLYTPWYVAWATAVHQGVRTLAMKLGAWFDEQRRHWRISADLRALDALDEVTLHDLGLHRSEIRSLLITRNCDERRHRVG